MPKRTDIESILIIGAGPIIIGQACEFDYSGTQATRALKEEGYRVILVNSNPATIMTDPELADATYITHYPRLCGSNHSKGKTGCYSSDGWRANSIKSSDGTASKGNFGKIQCAVNWRSS